MLLRYNLETVGTMKLHSFKHAISGRVLGVTQLQTFSSVSKFSQISDAIEYIYQFTYSSGISRMSSRGYMVFESISFGICYFALRYGEPGNKMYPGIEFYTSNHTMKQIPKVDNMINKFTYATIRLSSVYVTWKIKLVINDHLRGANGFSCSIQNLPWISITKPTLVTLSHTFNTKSSVDINYKTYPCHAVSHIKYYRRILSSILQRYTWLLHTRTNNSVNKNAMSYMGIKYLRSF